MDQEPTPAGMSEAEGEVEGEGGDEGYRKGDYVLEEGGEELEEDILEKSDSVTGMSAADKKKHQLEYLTLLKEIEGQNKLVENLKDELMQKCQNKCLTKCEIREIKKLRGCMENENLKLQCMIQKAIQMQNECPSKCWDEVPIVPTIEDDVFPHMGNVMASLGLAPQPTQDKKDVCKSCLKKPKRKKRGAEADCAMNKLFEEVDLKDQLIECLLEKLRILECQSKGGKSPRASEQRPCGAGSRLEESIDNMQCTVNRLKNEIKRLCAERESCERKPSRRQTPTQDEDSCKRQPNELRNLKEDYANLLAQYCKKEDQLKDFEGRVKGYSGDGASNSKTVDYAELKLLREKVNDLRDEQEEYTCIIKEQAEQLDTYRKKYVDAQQKVEEQKAMMDKMDMNNKQIESQIESEVRQIKAKFKEKLSELSQYPKLLENEQIKLATICKDKEELEGKLRLVCKELKTLKEQTASHVDKPDCSQKLAMYEQQLLLLTSQLEAIQKDKQLVCQELLRAKQDLDTMRQESAKIITTTKERFEITRASLCSQIDGLEKELAQCRATASLSITDRDAVIKEMQTQLNTLSYSFDSAQKQIKTLKNHITFLSNDQCIPIKC